MHLTGIEMKIALIFIIVVVGFTASFYLGQITKQQRLKNDEQQD